MLDLYDLSTWLLAGVTGLAGWVKTEFDKRPTRDELVDKLNILIARQDAMKEDIVEIKDDVKEIRTDINNRLE